MRLKQVARLAYLVLSALPRQPPSAEQLPEQADPHRRRFAAGGGNDISCASSRPDVRKPGRPIIVDNPAPRASSPPNMSPSPPPTATRCFMGPAGR